MRPPSACTIPGCPRRSVGQGLCAEHQQRRNARYEATRPSSTERGYDKDWARIRRQALADEPTCRVCGKTATEVHHINPIALGGTNDVENLACLCHSCHASITAREGGGYGNARRVERR
jgi:5-methylcytosine-specific restriction protein A